MQQKNWLAGTLVILIIGSVSIATALAYVGNGLEKGITFFAQILTFLVVIGLYGVWQDISIFNSSMLRMIALTYPLLVALSSLYPVIEYSEQTVPSSYIYIQGLEFILALFVSSILLKESIR
ncbi:TPA: hypothetical protein ACGUMO_000246 [Vibrio vulnificus]|uniref:hypothetical protein n=1 Tax=Vibrio vulnificus TaxID=672 RepID=UPI003242EB74|nr:hypothetical protein [Vibrio vulnificus]